MGKLKEKKHIVWFADINKINLNDEQNKKWWIRQVLLNGRLEDIKELHIADIKKFLPDFYLPQPVKKLWENYFEWKEKGTIDGIATKNH
ncbi:MAG: hypothetical protein M1135_02260 [Candidatus Omnitrophica bacterium]|nr:hypothetical protein [Candidatus Omnitrophota bacterium]